MSTFCATPWRSTHSIRAACTSAPAAARFTRLRMQVTAGVRSFVTCPPCSRSRCSRWRDPRRPAEEPPDTGRRRPRRRAQRRRSGYAEVGTGCPRRQPSVAARDDSRRGHEEAPADAEVLLLRGGLVRCFTGRALAGGGGVRNRALPDHWCNSRRLIERSVSLRRAGDQLAVVVPPKPPALFVKPVV